MSDSELLNLLAWRVARMRDLQAGREKYPPSDAEAVLARLEREVDSLTEQALLAPLYRHGDYAEGGAA